MSEVAQDIAAAEHEYGALPANGFVRLKQIKSIIPFSAATLWRKVAAKDFPAPVKLSAGVTAWRVEDIRAWIEARGVPQ